MTEEAFKQLAKSYAFYAQDSETKKVCQAVLKILGINECSGKLYFKETSIDPKIESTPSFKIDNFLEINSFDIECIEDILNNERYSSYITNLSFLFESIGWSLSNKSGKWKLCNLKNPISDIWLEGNSDWNDWKEKEEPIDTNWKKGTWKDNISLRDLKNPNWLGNKND